MILAFGVRVPIPQQRGNDMQAPLIIEDVILGTPQKTDRQEENLEFFAPSCLNDLYSYDNKELHEALWLEHETVTAMDRLHAVLPYVATYYDLDKTELLESWVKNHGINMI